MLLLRCMMCGPTVFRYSDILTNFDSGLPTAVPLISTNHIDYFISSPHSHRIYIFYILCVRDLSDIRVSHFIFLVTYPFKTQLFQTGSSLCRPSPFNSFPVLVLPLSSSHLSPSLSLPPLSHLSTASSDSLCNSSKLSFLFERHVTLLFFSSIT